MMLRLGLDESIPVTVTSEPADFIADGTPEAAYDYALAVTPLPGCGYIPETFPYRDAGGDVTIEAYVVGERAAGRDFRSRVRSGLDAAKPVRTTSLAITASGVSLRDSSGGPPQRPDVRLGWFEVVTKQTVSLA